MEDDKLRKEVWALSLVRIEMHITVDHEQMFKLLEKAERWLKLSIQMKLKVTRQLDAADVLFKLAMMLGEVERAVKVAKQGEQMAVIGFGSKNKIVQDWTRRKDYPVLYMIG